jgi:hypothetical protein
LPLSVRNRTELGFHLAIETLWNPGWGREMTTADEFRQYAQECLEWAKKAETDDQRQSFLDMARDWTLAALRVGMSKNTD